MHQEEKATLRNSFPGQASPTKPQQKAENVFDWDESNRNNPKERRKPWFMASIWSLMGSFPPFPQPFLTFGPVIKGLFLPSALLPSPDGCSSLPRHLTPWKILSQSSCLLLSPHPKALRSKLSDEVFFGLRGGVRRGVLKTFILFPALCEG